MKLTKRRIAFFFLHIFFVAVVPLGLIIYQYSTIGDTRAEVGFQISISGVLLLLLVFWIVKKVFIDRRLADLNTQANVMIADLKTESDPTRVKELEREIKNVRTYETIINAVIPLLFIVAVILCFRALEAQLIRLSATLGFIAVSFVIGTVFGVLHARQVKGKNRRDG